MFVRCTVSGSAEMRKAESAQITSGDLSIDKIHRQCVCVCANGWLSKDHLFAYIFLSNSLSMKSVAEPETV
jgi:hypothetical protein